MHRALTVSAAAILALVVGRVASAAPMATFDFESGTDQGFGGAFGADADITFAIANVNGSHYMVVPNTTAFQEGAVATGNTSSDLFMAMQAAAANPGGYQVTYDYYINTADLGAGTAGTYLQLGSYINTGNGAYGQNFPATGKELELTGTQLASGQIFTGTVTVPFQTYLDSALAGDPTKPITSTDTFYRLGLVVNGDGTGLKIDYDNITLAPVSNVPEPASLALLTLAAPALLRRRKA